MVAAVVTKTST